MPLSPPPTLNAADASHTASTCLAHDLTADQFAELHRRAVAAKATAYCPYSQFRVGAAVLSASSSSTSADGQASSSSSSTFFSGANVENAAYPVGTCAERVALATGVTAGHHRYKAVAVATDIAPPASPCGMCRQFIREFSDQTTPIIMFDKDDKYVVLRLDELLPMSFGPEALPPPGQAPASSCP